MNASPASATTPTISSLPPVDGPKTFPKRSLREHKLSEDAIRTSTSKQVQAARLILSELSLRDSIVEWWVDEEPVRHAAAKQRYFWRFPGLGEGEHRQEPRRLRNLDELKKWACTFKLAPAPATPVQTVRAPPAPPSGQRVLVSTDALKRSYEVARQQACGSCSAGTTRLIMSYCNTVLIDSTRAFTHLLSVLLSVPRR